MLPPLPLSSPSCFPLFSLQFSSFSPSPPVLCERECVAWGIWGKRPAQSANMYSLLLSISLWSLQHVKTISSLEFTLPPLPPLLLLASLSSPSTFLPAPPSLSSLPLFSLWMVCIFVCSDWKRSLLVTENRTPILQRVANFLSTERRTDSRISFHVYIHKLKKSAVATLKFSLFPFSSWIHACLTPCNWRYRRLWLRQRQLHPGSFTHASCILYC